MFRTHHHPRRSSSTRVTDSGRVYVDHRGNFYSTRSISPIPVTFVEPGTSCPVTTSRTLTTRSRGRVGSQVCVYKVENKGCEGKGLVIHDRKGYVSRKVPSRLGVPLKCSFLNSRSRMSTPRNGTVGGGGDRGSGNCRSEERLGSRRVRVGPSLGRTNLRLGTKRELTKHRDPCKEPGRLWS